MSIIIILPEGGNDAEGEDMDPFSDEFSPDDQLTPVEKLDKYFQSDDLMERSVIQHKLCFVL